MKHLITILFLSAIISCSKDAGSKVDCLSVSETVAATPVVAITFWCYGLDGAEQYQVHFTADNLKPNDILSVYYQIYNETGENQGWQTIDSAVDIIHNELGNEYGTYLRTFRLGCEGRLKVTVKRNGSVVASDIQLVHCEQCQ